MLLRGRSYRGRKAGTGNTASEVGRLVPTEAATEAADAQISDRALASQHKSEVYPSKVQHLASLV